jgi:hypothetical protein
MNFLKQKAIGRSSPRNCSHEALPFVEAAAKAKLAGSIETQARHHLAALSAFRIVYVPIISVRNKDVRREGGRVRLSLPQARTQHHVSPQLVAPVRLGGVPHAWLFNRTYRLLSVKRTSNRQCRDLTHALQDQLLRNSESSELCYL